MISVLCWSCQHDKRTCRCLETLSLHSCHRSVHVYLAPVPNPCVRGSTIHTSHQSSSKVAANSDAVDVVAVGTGAWLSSSSPPPLLLLSRRGCKVSVKASTEWLTISADNEPGKAWLDTLIVGQHVWFLLRSTNVVETVAKTSDVVHLVTVN